MWGFFIVSVVKQWKRLLKEAVVSLSLEILKPAWTQPWATCSSACLGESRQPPELLASLSHSMIL